MALISTGNQADKVAVGTDAQRPTSPVEGQVRFNTDEECLEVYGIFAGEGDWKCTGGAVCHVLPPDPALLPKYDDNEQGDLWYNTEDGKLYIWYDDGVGPPNAQWVDASPKTRLGQEKRFGIIGEVVAFAGIDVPDGWLECDGKAIPANYTELIAVVGSNNTPDLRGEFIRGWDHGRGIDSGRGILSAQVGSTAMPNTAFGTTNPGNHTHSYYDRYFQPGQAQWGENLKSLDRSGKTTGGAGGHTHTITGGDAETRPRNVAMMYIIYAGED